MANQAKTVVHTDQRLGSSQTQESISFLNAEEIVDKLFLDLWIEIYYYVTTKNNVNRALEREFRIHKVESSKQ